MFIGFKTKSSIDPQSQKVVMLKDPKHQNAITPISQKLQGVVVAKRSVANTAKSLAIQHCDMQELVSYGMRSNELIHLH